MSYKIRVKGMTLGPARWREVCGVKNELLGIKGDESVYAWM